MNRDKIQQGVVANRQKCLRNPIQTIKVAGQTYTLTYEPREMVWLVAGQDGILLDGNGLRLTARTPANAKKDLKEYLTN